MSTLPTTNPLAGLRVAAFESRRAEEMTRLIERHGGQAFVSPSLREVPLEENDAALEFARAIISGHTEIVILLTGVGTRYLVSAIQPTISREELLAALAQRVTVVRGPKPLAVLREWGFTPSVRVPEPNTWRELLEALDREAPVAGRVVGLQEYGQPNTELVAGLEARGARVECLKVYDWALPLDVGPLEQNLQRLIDGAIDVALFTSRPQLLNLLALAERQGRRAALEAALRSIVLGSIGPTTSESLRAAGLPVDFEPEHSKMGTLVAAAAERAPRLVERKRAVTAVLTSETARPSSEAALHNSLFLRACRREPTERTPIWLMRQAGRYLPEYRAIRGRVSFLELCKSPELSAEVMIRTVERLGVDAAIIFSDLLPILEPMGFSLEYSPGEGPLIHNPLREGADVDRVVELESVEALDFVMETVRLTRAGLPPEIPVIGFAGAPFTLASYTIEGGASRSFAHTKTLMYRDPGALSELLARLARSVARYLQAQIAAGASAVQLFDSWVGCLSPEDYRRHVLPHTRAVFEQLPPGFPAIHFTTGNPALLPAVAEAGGTVIGVDWRIGLDDAWRAVGHDRAVQGNLDPTALLADRAELKRQADDVLRRAAGRPGHIFNLGHGVLPETPVDSVLALIEHVRASGRTAP